MSPGNILNTRAEFTRSPPQFFVHFGLTDKTGLAQKSFGAGRANGRDDERSDDLEQRAVGKVAAAVFTKIMTSEDLKKLAREIVNETRPAADAHELVPRLFYAMPCILTTFLRLAVAPPDR